MAALRQDDGGGDNTALCCCLSCSCLAVLFLLLGVPYLLEAYAFLDPLQVTAAAGDDDAARFALNGTALAYDLSLAVSVRNPNWGVRAVHAAPLGAELRFAGRRVDGAVLAPAGRSVEPEETVELRLRAAGEKASAAEVLGSDGVAELVEETAAGQLESLELRVSGKIKYRPVHLGGDKVDVSCQLRLPTAAPGRTIKVSDEVIKCQ